MSTQGPFPRNVAARAWADHSLPSGAVVKITWSSSFTAQCLSKHKFIFQQRRNTKSKK
jgi:hypothetical protein